VEVMSLLTRTCLAGMSTVSSVATVATFKPLLKYKKRSAKVTLDELAEPLESRNKTRDHSVKVKENKTA